VGSQFETVELRIAHVVSIVAADTLLDLHAFHIRRLHGVFSPGVVAFFTCKTVLVFFMGESGGFIAGRTFQFHNFRAGITCIAGAASYQEEGNKDQHGFMDQRFLNNVTH